MKIMDRADAISKALGEDVKLTGGKTAFKVKDAAILATLGGRGSDDWRDYMTILACNEDQLKRLTGKDSQANQAYVRESSAYLVTNATCGGHTTSRLTEFLDKRLDDDLNSQTDPNFVRILEIKLLPPPPDNEV